MNYIIDSPIENEQRNATNTSYVHIGQQISSSSLYNQIPDLNEENIQLKSITFNKNDFISNKLLSPILNHGNAVEISYNTDESKNALKENVKWSHLLLENYVILILFIFLFLQVKASLKKLNTLNEIDNIEVEDINKKMRDNQKIEVK